MFGGIYPGSDRAWLEVDLAAVRHNADRLRARAGAPLVPMIKADGYGTGAVAVARALGAPFADAPAAGGEPAGAAGDPPWALGIATLDEAAALRDAGCVARVLCTSPLLPDSLPRALALGVRPALHRAADIARWAALGGGPWHLGIDTGMSRAGIRWDAVAALRDLVRAHPPEGVFTHFHSADDLPATQAEQEARFRGALAELGDALPPGILRHAANSPGIAGGGAGAWDLARPGIGVYGAGPEEALGLRPVVHLRARVVDLRQVEPGETVSYGATWTADTPRQVATLAAGYGDGYRRHLSNRGTVLLRGVPCAVVGRVTMDMTMVDVTGVGVAVGDVATLIGRDGDRCLTVNAVAEAGGVSPYELLVGLRLRVPPRYLPEDPR